jgi:D-alanyl-D-alanine carboxypeptidase
LRKRFRIGLGILAIASFLVTGLNVNALERYAFRSDTYYITPEELWQEEQRALREEWFNREPETNNITNWSTGPLVHARSAIVMEVDTGVVLYSKNGTEVLYPASITKLLTLLVALDYSELTEQIEFTETSMSMVRWDYAHIPMQLGEVISM